MAPTSGPSFLCIGAPKTGTTWLYKHLSAHPEIWIPPVKELHYFDRKFPLPKAGVKVTVRRGIFGLFPQHDRRKVVRVIGRSLVRASMPELAWAYRYLSATGTEQWYLSLFDLGRGRVSGELTTDYCGLAPEGVRHVRALVPDVKVIFLMRDPIERAWSHAKMLLPELSGKPLSSISTQQFIDYLCHPGPRTRGDYVRTLANWESAFPSAQIFIGFSEDIRQRPQAFLREVLTFLGVSPQIAGRSDLSERVNPGSTELPAGPPAEIAHVLARMYLADLETLAARFSVASAWLRKAQALLELPEAVFAGAATEVRDHASTRGQQR